MPNRIHKGYDGEMMGWGDYGYAASILHALCTLYSFCLFELLSQRPSLLRLVDGRQIVYKKAVREIDI
ncbi:uncharacterized protein ASPGLDRAFT_52734 [Aspergillus glaucus CBS 516.65]|uniref:Uncharacterized protein n=1 Tax=Aspergillus glaucus CBS 516.65 TaxID=1160497 RepID=A0A1L9V5X6_ASPGL|nr:hypothetical protein ASPGLDRAFT_52734 [Aspergillus glaucus CBS 516.65]OJJ79279.1 hypothetical protein ASPGLDRAFT_52734 [Aspergillus glaucus CBS 516.65]